MDELESSPIKWEAFYKTGEIVKSDKKVPRPHQVNAIENTVKGFKSLIKVNYSWLVGLEKHSPLFA